MAPRTGVESLPSLWRVLGSILVVTGFVGSEQGLIVLPILLCINA